MLPCKLDEKLLRQWLDDCSAIDAGESRTNPPKDATRLHVDGCRHCQQRLDEWLKESELDAWRAANLQSAMPLTSPLLERLKNLPNFVTNSAMPASNDVERATVLSQLANYQILGEIGRGGMGVVYRAVDRRLGREVAIKVLEPPTINREMRARFVREGQAMASIDDRGVMPIFDVIDDPHCPALVMPFMEGGSLSHRIAAKDYTYRDAARWTMEVAQALVTVHRQGFLHRDIKPGNVLLDDQERVKLSDFGLVRWQSDFKLTDPQVVPGTPEYLSPESLQPTPTSSGPAGDIYQCGVLLYELLVGQPPYRGTLTEVLQQIVEARPIAPRSIRRDIPADLQLICLKAIQRLPCDRYKTASELSVDLSRFLEGHPVFAKPPSRLKRWARLAQRSPRQTVGITLLLAASSVSLGLAAYQRLATTQISNENQQLILQTQQLDSDNLRLSRQRDRAQESMFAAQSVAKQTQQQSIQLAFNSVAPRNLDAEEAAKLFMQSLLGGFENTLQQAIAEGQPESQIATAAVAAASLARQAELPQRVSQHADVALQYLQRLGEDPALTADPLPSSQLTHIVALRLWLEANLKNPTNPELRVRLARYQELIDQSDSSATGLSMIVERAWFESFRLAMTPDQQQRPAAMQAWQAAVDESQQQPIFKNVTLDLSKFLLAQLEQLDDPDSAIQVRGFLEQP